MKYINKLTEFNKLGGVKFNILARQTAYKSKRTTMQLLALSFAIFVPSFLFSCVNQIPGYNEDNEFNTRQQSDTTARDSIGGFPSDINPWGDGGELGTDTIYETDPEDLDEDVYDYFFGDDENE